MEIWQESKYLIVGLLCFISLYQELQYFAVLEPEAVYLDGVDMYSHLGKTFYEYGIGNAEYFPMVTNTQRLTKEIQLDESLQVIDYEREYLRCDTTVINGTNQERSIIFPIVLGYSRDYFVINIWVYSML